MTIIILGAGIAGLSAAYHLQQTGIESIILEKEDTYGGLCRSVPVHDSVFDIGVHVSFTQDEYVKKIFSNSVHGEYIEHESVPGNYWHGSWIPHQPQDHLSYLPKDIARTVLVDFIRAYCQKKGKIRNYREWCHNAFGDFFAENFTDVYTKKFWTVDPDMLTTDWIGNRLHRPDPDSIICGALGIPKENSHYVTKFRYPKKGGYHSFITALAQDLKICYNTFPEKIDPSKKEIQLKSGETIHYDRLISSIPLPELIGCIPDAPEKIVRAKNELKWTSLCLLNYRTDKKELLSSSLWNYYYDAEIPYSRIFYMSRFSRMNAAPDYDTIQVEIPYSKDNPLKKGIRQISEDVMHYLSKTEKIERESIRFLSHFDVKYGYVIYDTARSKSVKIIHEYLDKEQIACCGRFGEWAYLWSDQAFLSGKNAADSIVKTMV